MPIAPALAPGLHQKSLRNWNFSFSLMLADCPNMVEISRDCVSRGVGSRRSAIIRVKEHYVQGNGVQIVRGSIEGKSRLLVPSLRSLQVCVPVLSLNWLQCRPQWGVVFLGTVVRYVLEQSRRRDRQKYESLLLDQGVNFIIMLNDCMQDLLSTQRLDGSESLEAYVQRTVVTATQWLMQHTTTSSVEVLLCDDSDPMRQVCLEHGTPFITIHECFSALGDTVDDELGDASWAALLASCLTLARDREEAVSSCPVLGAARKPCFSGHLSLADMRAGIRSEVLMPGLVLEYNRKTGHALVDLEPSPAADAVTTGKLIMLVPCKKRLNRAFAGDRVVVRLLPRREWRTGHGREHQGEHAMEEDDDLAHTDESESEMDGHGVEMDIFDKLGLGRGDQDGDGERVPACEVVGILERGAAVYEGVPAYVCKQRGDSGTLNGSNNANPNSNPNMKPSRRPRVTTLLAWPFDTNLPPFRVTTSSPASVEDRRVLVRLSDWPFTSALPTGNIVSVLSTHRAGDGTLTLREEIEEEVKIILERHRFVNRPFSLAAQRRLPMRASGARVWEPSVEHSARRRDLRTEHLVFSVDPNGCTDIDDAMSIRFLPLAPLGSQSVPNGTCAHSCSLSFELGVHIADVMAFLHKEDALASEGLQRGTTNDPNPNPNPNPNSIFRRYHRLTLTLTLTLILYIVGTTVYMPHRRVDMLPPAISGDAASLHGVVLTLTLARTLTLLES